MIVDDDDDVHLLTKTVLRNLNFKGKSVEFLSVYSGEDAVSLMNKVDDIAMILLDVVMETDDAGLQAAKKIRQDLNNNLVQIILRTGQPGTAPEHDVVIDYAINDYKEKTELTSRKLTTAVVTSLRSYENMKTLDATKRGLRKIIDSSESMFDESNAKEFTRGILFQLISLLRLNHDSDTIESFNGISIEKNGSDITILNATGNLTGVININQLDADVKSRIMSVMNDKISKFSGNTYTGYLQFDSGISNVIYISGNKEIDHLDRNLLEVFFHHISIAYHNLRLHEEMLSTQKTLIEMLGDVIEERYQDAPNHVKRVAEISYLLACDYGMSIDDANIFRLVSPMHDVGKIGISDAILLKPGKLSTEEFEKMKAHTTIGHDILKDFHKDTLDVASIVAYEHHENWDGTGYPRGLKGKEISIYGRITAIADVFDALANKRCYKKAWSIDKILAFFEEKRGSQFDPELTDLLFKNMDKIIEIETLYH